jgi:hypothetical protein
VVALFAPSECVKVATASVLMTTSVAFCSSDGLGASSRSLDCSAHRDMDEFGCLDGFTVLTWHHPALQTILTAREHIYQSRLLLEVLEGSRLQHMHLPYHPAKLTR